MTDQLAAPKTWPRRADVRRRAVASIRKEFPNWPEDALTDGVKLKTVAGDAVSVPRVWAAVAGEFADENVSLKADAMDKASTIGKLADLVRRGLHSGRVRAILAAAWRSTVSKPGDLQDDEKASASVGDATAMQAILGATPAGIEAGLSLPIAEVLPGAALGRTWAQIVTQFVDRIDEVDP